MEPKIREVVEFFLDRGVIQIEVDKRKVNGKIPASANRRESLVSIDIGGFYSRAIFSSWVRPLLRFGDV